MPSWKYSVEGLDPDKTAIASARDLKVSPKASREICRFIRGMELAKAKETLHQVIDLKKPVPFFRHDKKIPHRGGVQGFDSGRFPVKAAGEILKLLNAVEANAEFKGLYADRLRIRHIATQRARVLRDYIPRAFGRSSPFNDHLTHVEVAVEEF